MSNRFLVTGLNSGLNGDSKGHTKVFDLEGFYGRVTLSPIKDGTCCEWYDDFDLHINDEAEYETFKLGQVRVVSFPLEQVAAGAGYSGSETA